jgi:hypothetical protein
MTNADCQDAVVSLTEDEAARIDAASTRLTVTGDDPFSDPADQAMARAVVTESWPGVPQFAARIGEMVRREPYFAIVRGIPVAAPDTFFVALTSSIGEPIDPFKQSWSRLIYRILPRNDVFVEGEGVLNEHLHTDGTNWPAPNDLTCLLCERPDQNGGGRSRLLPIGRLLDHVRATDESLLDLLASTPVPWSIMESLGGGVRRALVLTEERIRWLRYTIDTAVAGGAEIDQRVAAVLDTFEKLVDDCPSAFELELAAGDLLLVNNAKCMHARTPVSNPTESARTISRIKVMI